MPDIKESRVISVEKSRTSAIDFFDATKKPPLGSFNCGIFHLNLLEFKTISLFQFVVRANRKSDKKQVRSSADKNFAIIIMKTHNKKQPRY